jgi:hypothetical protein
LSRGRYELQKSALLDRFVRRRSILNDPARGSLPPQFVQSELLKFMVEAASSTYGVVVVNAGSGLGKSAAAKFVLKNSAGGIMFCNMMRPRIGCYWEGVARALGIPENYYDEDWQDLLVSSVAAAAASPPEVRTGLLHMMSNFKDGLLSMCGTATDAETEEQSPPTIDGLDLTVVRKRPIIVFDDFNDVTDDDILLIQVLFPILDAQKVLLFVLVNKEATANKLVGLNGWRRVAPLEGICRPIQSDDGKTIEPEWMPIHWTRSQLEEIVRSRYDNVIVQNMSDELLKDDANPIDVLRYAERLSLTAAAAAVTQNIV